jgi:ATP-dependent DNA ligase
MRFDASALDSVSSNSSPVSRHKVSRYERCASVMGSSPVFHSSGSRCNAGWAVSFVDCFVMGRMDRKTRATAAGKTAGASHTAAAGFIEPMLLLRTDALPDSERWLYELKLDGYRAIAFKRNGTIHLRSRNDNDFSRRYPSVVKGLARLPDNTVIDGEVVAFDDDGRPSFNALQNYGSAVAPVVYYVFDVMVFAGRDVMQEPLEKRRELLEKKVLPKLAEPIRYASSLDAALPVLVQSVKTQGLEGLVAKRRNSVYEPGQRSGAWMKMRVNRGQEFVIGGYTRGTQTFDALVFGYYQGATLIYVARTRNGFTPVTRAQLFKKFKALRSMSVRSQISLRPGAGVGDKDSRKRRWQNVTG